MNKRILAVTGDTHGEEGRFLYPDMYANRHLSQGDYLFVCGDFGYVFTGSYKERQFLDFLAENVPYTICFCDGNHENFDLINSYDVTTWNGGKVHIIKRDFSGMAKIIHLMRGQVYDIEGKRIFVFGGAYSIDRDIRVEGRSWWPQEMPDDEDKEEAIRNLDMVNWEVDYVITHTAPEDTMSMFHLGHEHEASLNSFLEYIREKTKYKHWYMGHLHRDEDVWRQQTILWFSLRNMEDNTEFE